MPGPSLVRTAPLRVLRVAVDAQKLLYDKPAPWAVLAEHWPEAVRLDVAGEPLQIARAGADPGAVGHAVYLGLGVRVLLRAPEHCDRSRGLYGVELDVQGLACSSSADGLEAVDAVRLAVEAWLWPDDDDAAERCYPGRLDVCVDVSVELPPEAGSQWIEREVFAHGRIDAACSRFTTRSSQRRRQLHGAGPRDEAPEAPRELPQGARLLGSRESGRTLYLGRDPRLKIYEKDKDPGRDVPLVKARWREAGWDGETRVLRIESTVTRTWLAETEVQRPDGERMRLGGPEGVTWLTARRWLSAIGAEVLRRTVMRARTGRAEAKKRDQADLWAAARRALDLWTEALAARDEAGSVPEWRGLGELRSRARELSRERAIKRVESGLAELHAHSQATARERGESAPDVGDVALWIAALMVAGEGRYGLEELDKRARRCALRLGLPAPPSLGAREVRVPPDPWISSAAA